MHQVIAAALVLLCSAFAQATVDLELVPVGNPGNAGQLSGSGYIESRICGAVDYSYSICKFEVTTAQYVEFLNAVAATDTYSLYDPVMWSGSYGCGIQRSGAPGTYTYSVAPDRANRPVSDVSWGDAARFANWMHNGQPTGAQGSATTEDGSYFLNGVNSSPGLLEILREPDATWCIPNEDEWYKAAYHKNDGPTGNYWVYPWGNNDWTFLSNQVINPDPGGNANYYTDYMGFTIGSPYFRTEVGEFENSESPYGTFDQGGNVCEWTESVLYGISRGVRGGAYSSFGATPLTANFRAQGSIPEASSASIGLRLTLVPEPSPVALLLLAVFFGSTSRRRS